ncbi:MAG: hypothetical protein PUP90_01790 [Nostoc sp. S4]|nr:hypothetical protein [Nostoc sp. S4]
MNTVITPERIELQAGTIVRMLGTWEDYQALNEQLGDRHIYILQMLIGYICTLRNFVSSIASWNKCCIYE